MTATPIPRTLALTACGDMDVSVMRDRPPGRQPMRTLVRPETRRDEVYGLMRAAVAGGRQVYVVYPLVEESEKIDLKAATTMAAHLADTVFPDLRVALLHGRLKADEKERVMRRFTAGEVQILVCTTVVEVGVDVPNATVMVVEHAERFGLSQLHQLRGRIGRGSDASTCVLLYDAPWSEEARARLTALSATERRLRPGRDATSRSAAPAISSARASRACRRCAPATWCATPICWRWRTRRPGAWSTPTPCHRHWQGTCAGSGSSSSAS